MHMQNPGHNALLMVHPLLSRCPRIMPRNPCLIQNKLQPFAVSLGSKWLGPDLRRYLLSEEVACQLRPPAVPLYPVTSPLRVPAQ